jgi:hypothetical protein
VLKGGGDDSSRGGVVARSAVGVDRIGADCLGVGGCGVIGVGGRSKDLDFTFALDLVTSVVVVSRSRAPAALPYAAAHDEEEAGSDSCRGDNDRGIGTIADAVVPGGNTSMSMRVTVLMALRLMLALTAAPMPGPPLTLTAALFDSELDTETMEGPNCDGEEPTLAAAADDDDDASARSAARVLVFALA